MTLDDGTTSITIPNSLQWVDEYDWTPIGQDKKPTIGGGLVISESHILKGRPITLNSGVDVIVTKAIVDALYALYIVADKTYTLTLPDLRTFEVMYDRSSENAFEPKQLFRINVPSSTHEYTLTLRLMEV